MFMKLIGTKLACRLTATLLTMLCAVGTVSCAKFDNIVDQDDLTSRASAQTANDSDLVIQNDSPLPDTYPLADYELRFRARGGVVPLHWKIEKGVLPPGLKLEEDGLLHGRPERSGEFQFTVSLRDSGQARAVQKGFVLRVVSALTVNWKIEAHVNGSRIEGSVNVSNTTPDDIDLTYIVLAVPPNGRAVAIGYQHFPLRRGTVDMELPFGETLPRGGYVVHVDVIGEVATKNVIHRQRLQTASALQVMVGP
jgi:Putative Ig domain